MGKIFKNYSKIDFSSPDGRQKVFAAVQAFANKQRDLNKRQNLLRHELQIQAMSQLRGFGAAGDFPASVLPVLEKFRLQAHYDTGYEEIFNIRDARDSKRAGFSILDVEHGLAFSAIEPGGKAKIYKMGGTKVDVDYVTYGGGLGWLRTLIEDEEWWTLEDNAEAWINRSGYDKAAAHYALIEAIAAGYNVAWANPDPATLSTADPTYTANRDAQTINAAAIAIAKAVKAKGYGLDPKNLEYVILTPFDYVPRLTRALGLLLQGFGGSPAIVPFRFRLIPTLMLANTTPSYYVCLPKHKAMGGNRMDLEILSEYDITSRTDIAVGWMRFGAAIGDSDQFRRCLIS